MTASPAPDRVERAGVLGAGVMGAAIAAHLANLGIPTILLDLAGKEGEDRNGPAQAGLDRARKSKPASFAAKGVERLVSVGNFEDDLPRLAECDWVLEAVVENLDIKRSLYEKVAPHVAPHAVLSTNTSGLSVQALSDTLPEALRARFMATHFFNPPRYLKLLELVPGPETDPAVVEFFERFGEGVLGKGVVHAKDTPNFIANRIGTYGMLHILHGLGEGGYTVAEIDALTGRALGRPKSATFRTADLVGLDTLVHVARTLHEALHDDPERALYEPPDFVRALLDQGRLGEKSGAGFYKKVKGPEGTEILMLDPATGEYVPQGRVSIASLGAARVVDDVRERVRGLVLSDDRGGAFLWPMVSATLRYAAACVPEIADDIVSVDRALRWGFGWDLGPFELWDALGFQESCARMVAEGHELPPLAQALRDAGVEGFYRREEGRTSYVAVDATWTDLAGHPAHLVLADLKDAGGVVLETPDASLVDLGDGVGCLEFHTKMNTIGPGIIDMMERSLDEVEGGWKGLVLGNDAAHFGAGANLLIILNEIDDGNEDEVAWILERFQRVNQRLRLSPVPVVAAPHGLVLGGACEVVLGGDAVCAHMESYIGLVEVGAGLIPAGGGCKELVRRADEAALAASDTDLFPYVRRIFETVGMGKVSSSALEAREMGFLRPTDHVSANRDRLLHDAKQTVLAMARRGYTPPRTRDDIRVVGEPGLAALRVGLDQMRRADYISDHDKLVGEKLAWVLCGGEISPSARVSEDYLLELEREAFMSLLEEEKTLERMEHLLKTGKPLRN